MLRRFWTLWTLDSGHHKYKIQNVHETTLDSKNYKRLITKAMHKENEKILRTEAKHKEKCVQMNKESYGTKT